MAADRFTLQYLLIARHRKVVQLEEVYRQGYLFIQLELLMVDSQMKTPRTIGVLHPGQMGVTFAAALVSSGHRVYWASEGRSTDTQNRAKMANLHDAKNLQALCSNCRFVFSICPPDQATAVAQQAVDHGFNGTYIDCNAVSPSSAKRVATILTQAGGTCIDGGIIGPPAIHSDTTRLYLSGDSAVDVASLFERNVIEAKVIGTDIGAASALKMAYAGWTKGSMALLMTQFALARQQGVESALLEEWLLSQAGLAEKLDKACTSSAPKAWRFNGEMKEIADTLDQAGLPRGWFDAAADTYERLSGFKNMAEVDQQAVISALLKHTNSC